MTEWAAKVLEGVGRIWAYSYEVNEADNGAEPEDWKTFQTWDVADPYPILGKEYVAVDDALAAIARMGAGDGLVEQAIAELQDVVHCRCHEAYIGRGLRDPDCQCDSQDAVHVLAAHIAALTAQVAEAQAALDSIETSHGLTSNGNMWRFWAKQAREVADKNAELRAKVARLEEENERWKKAFAAQSNKLQKVLDIPGVRAALTDGGKDG